MSGEFYATIGLILFGFGLFALAVAWGDYQTSRPRK